MGGLALGSELGARIADRVRAPILAYALAEAVVGGYALASQRIFARAYDTARGSAFSAEWGWRLRSWRSRPWRWGRRSSPRGRCRAVARGAARGGRGALAVNLAGGVVGAIVTGFVALPELGQRATTEVLGGVGIAVAIAAVVVSRGMTPARREPSAQARCLLPSQSLGPSRPLSQRGEGREESRLAPWIAAWIGLVSFALQVAYNRVLALLLGAAAYTFALVVGIILAATALGGAVSSRQIEDDAAGGLDPFWAKVSRRCLALALSVYMGTLVVYVAPFYLAWAASHLASMTWVRVGSSRSSWARRATRWARSSPRSRHAFPLRGVGRAAGRAVAREHGRATCSARSAPRSSPFPCVASNGRSAPPARSRSSPRSSAGWKGGRAPFVGIAPASGLACVLAVALRPAWDAVGLSAGSYRVRGYRAVRGRLRRGSVHREPRPLLPRRPGRDGRRPRPRRRRASARSIACA